MQKLIDPHLHFFDLKKGNYAWLRPNNPPFWPDKTLIVKNIMPSDLIIDNNEFTLIGGVHIEAGFDNEKSQNELKWLEQEVYPIEAKYAYKSISYIDLKKPCVDFKKQLIVMIKYPTFVGIRYIIDNNESLSGELKDIIENLKFLENVGKLLEVQLSFCNISQVNYLLKIMAEVPSLTLVVNHSGLPPLGFSQSDEHRLGLSNDIDKAFIEALHIWENNLSLFAELPNCFIKCSGFEMQNRRYTKQDVIEILSRVNAQFGNNRMMLASNFPLTLFATSYRKYWKLLVECAKEAHLDCELLMHRNAKEVYQF